VDNTTSSQDIYIKQKVCESLLVFAGESFSLKLLQYFRDTICDPVAQECSDISVVRCSDQSAEILNISITRIEIAVQTYFASIGLIGVPASTEILAANPSTPSLINLGISKSCGRVQGQKYRPK
jgi:hypothetical protein